MGKDEGAGAEGDLGLARGAAAVTEQRGLLIDDRGADGDAIDLAEIADIGLDFGEVLRSAIPVERCVDSCPVSLRWCREVTIRRAEIVLVGRRFSRRWAWRRG